jgi:transketolase C-terminal domain/subunit
MVENRSIFGGPGSAVAEVMAENPPCWMSRAGIPELFEKSGSNRKLMEKDGLNTQHIAEVAMSTIKKER